MVQKVEFMDTVLLENELEEIRMRCDRATPGPWISFWEGRDHTSGDSVIQRGDQAQFDDLYITPCIVADQDFIAHARQDIPKLVDEILLLRRMLAESILNTKKSL
jgi:hypothetical protein